jgi:hypothetical protein
MASPSTREQFKDYCLRRLGYPVIDINVADEQVEDRIDDALQFFHDYHFDGVEKIFMKHQITQTDIDRRWIYVPDVIIGITSIFPFDNSNASVNMFDLRYQLRLHDLYDFTSVSYVPYTITMQHIRTLNLLFSGTPAIRFNRHVNKLYLDIDWPRDVQLGEYLVVECYRKLAPDTFTGTGTVSVATGSKDITGSETIFYREFIPGDEITINGETRRIINITSDTAMNVESDYTSTASSQQVTKAGLSDVWNDRFLKQYATAMIKKQWGENLKKFGNVQMPGGVVLNGQVIWDEATAEIQKIEEEMQIYNVLPNEIMIG